MFECQITVELRHIEQNISSDISAPHCIKILTVLLISSCSPAMAFHLYLCSNVWFDVSAGLCTHGKGWLLLPPRNLHFQGVGL